MERVFLLSGHSLFGRGVEALLRGEAELEIVGRETNVETAIELIKQLQPDAVVVDSNDREVDLKPVVMRILEKTQGTKIIGLNLEDNTLQVYRGEQRIAKRVEDLVEAIRSDTSHKVA